LAQTVVCHFWAAPSQIAKMSSLSHCEFALPRITLAIAGSGCDVIHVRLVSRSWHCALRKHFANGLLEELRLHLNLDAFIAEMTSRPGGEDDSEEEEESYGCGVSCRQRRPPGEFVLVRPGSCSEVTGRLLSPCGSRVTLVTADRQIRTLEVASGRQLHALAGHTGAVQALTYSPCARFMLTASLDGTARVWDAGNGAEVRTFTSTSGPLYDAVFSPCGCRVLASSFGGEVVAWDSQTGEELLRMQGHGAVVFSCDYSRDGNLVLTTSRSGCAKLWDAWSGAELCTLFLPGTKLRGASFSPADPFSVFAVADDGTMVLWAAPDGAVLQRWSGHRVAAASFSPFGDRLVVTTRDYCVWLFAVDIGDASRLGQKDSDSAPTWEGETCLYESETYEPQLASFSPCGRYVLTASGGITGTVRLWDATSLQELCAYEVTPGTVSGVNKAGFAPCGGRLLVATYNGAVMVWGRGPAF